MSEASNSGSRFNSGLPTMSDDDRRLHGMFVAGLRNAYAMEREAVAIMEARIAYFSRHSEIAARLRMHLEETRAQQKRLEEILAKLGVDTIMYSHPLIGSVGRWHTLVLVSVDDPLLRATFAHLAFEKLEALAYRWLLAVAKLGEYHFAIPLLEQSLEEEFRMSGHIETQIDHLTEEKYSPRST